MNDNTAPKQQQQPRQQGDRTPIRIEKLLFTSHNPNGIKIPDGDKGTNERFAPFLIAGENSGTKYDIEWRPWMRMYRVVKSKKISRSGQGKDAKEVLTWEMVGKPFLIPEALAVAVLAEDL